MEVQVRERLVGALVLVAVVVLFVPALLKGPRRAAEPENAPLQQSVEVDLGVPDVRTQEDLLVPEPAPEPAPPEPLPVTADAGVPAPAPPPEPEPKPESDRPPAQLRTAAPESRPLPAPAQAGEAWAVQLGAFSARDKAEGLVRELRQRGYSAFVLEYRATGKVLHRVRVGPEQDRARAVAIAERLRKDGFQPVVAPHP